MYVGTICIFQLSVLFLNDWKWTTNIFDVQQIIHCGQQIYYLLKFIEQKSSKCKFHSNITLKYFFQFS